MRMLECRRRPLASCGLLLFIYNLIVSSAVTASDVITQDILMPGVRPRKNDEYLCTAKPVNAKEAFIVKMEAKADSAKAHHILLFACSFYLTNKDYWECGEGVDCPNMKILFAWAKNAPPTTLPDNVGFRIGSENNVNYLILQVHYATPLNEMDSSGLTLQMTYQPQAYVAGIFLLLAGSTVIPPHKEKIHGDINCAFSSSTPIHAFAYRVHTHTLGVVVTGYRISHQSRKFTEIAKGNPQWPQAFYPMTQLFTIHKNDYLAARCTFNSSLRDRPTMIGSTTNDEMCNLYIMYYTDIETGEDFYTCSDVQEESLVSLMPADSDTPLPRNALLEEHAMGSHKEHTAHSNMHQTEPGDNGNSVNNTTDPAMILPNKKGHKVDSNNAANGKEYPDFEDGSKSPAELLGAYNYYDVSRGHIHHAVPSSTPLANEFAHNTNANATPEAKGLLDWFSPAQYTSLYNDEPDWPQLNVELGQVTSVALDSQGNIVIFHRGNAVWGFSTFSMKNVYNGNRNNPIATDTIITIDRTTGRAIKSWGRDFFFMPHGLFLDSEDNVWVTDVALHQVFKFSANGDTQPSMTLGVRFYPGNDNDHFCKPSSVVVAKTGEFYVADGYCNNRILKYSAKGVLLLQWGQATRSVLGFKIGSLPPYAFAVPHDLALAEDRGLIFVADRENGRVQAFHMQNGTFHSQIADKEFGGRLFAIAYSPANGGTLYAVNGPTANIWRSGVKGFVIQLSTRKVIGFFTPTAKAMSNPHDIVVTDDGNTVYVAEIGPNRVIKFTAASDAFVGRQFAETPETKAVSNMTKPMMSSVNTPKPVLETVQINKLVHADDSKAVKEKVDEHSGLFGSASFSASMIIMALLAVPVLLMMIIAAVIRFRKRGKFHNCSVGHVKGWMSGYKTSDSDRFVIGNLLKNRHKGFDRVSMEDSDVDGGESDSDVEEYTDGGLNLASPDTANPEQSALDTAIVWRDDVIEKRPLATPCTAQHA